MQINFDTLNFKLDQPTSRSINNGCTQQEEAPNPFRKSGKPFRHFSRQKSRQQSSSQSLTLPRFKDAPLHNFDAPSLYNFDSFQKTSNLNQNQQKYKSNGNDHNFLSFKPQEVRDVNYIRIQENSSKIQDYSIILDDINSTLKVSDILYDSKNNYGTHRIKTQPCFNIAEDNEEKLIVNLQSKFDEELKQTTENPSTLHQVQKSERITHKSPTFFLTQQSESLSQCSSIKQFYMDLREQTKLFNDSQRPRIKTEPSETMDFTTEQIKSNPLKKRIKKIIYSFVDELEILEQEKISPDFVGKLETCLKHLERSEDYQPKKWEKPLKSHQFLKKGPYDQRDYLKTGQSTSEKKQLPKQNVCRNTKIHKYNPNNTTNKKWTKPKNSISPKKGSLTSTISKLKPFK